MFKKCLFIFLFSTLSFSSFSHDENLVAKEMKRTLDDFFTIISETVSPELVVFQETVVSDSQMMGFLSYLKDEGRLEKPGGAMGGNAYYSYAFLLAYFMKAVMSEEASQVMVMKSEILDSTLEKCPSCKILQIQIMDFLDKDISVTFRPVEIDGEERYLIWAITKDLANYVYKHIYQKQFQ